MTIGYFLRVGDKTTCGGQILTGDQTMQWYGVAGAREGDLVSCGKHSGAYRILGGISSVWAENRKVAGTLESFSSCPCKSRFINSLTDCYSSESDSSESFNKNNSESSLVHHIRYLCQDDNGEAISNAKYFLYLATGERIDGETDDKGYTAWYESDNLIESIIHIIHN